MPINQIELDDTQKQVLQFIRKSNIVSRNERGDVISTSDIIIGSEISNLQPWGARLEFEGGAAVEETNRNNATHMAFPQKRVEGLKDKDYVIDENGVYYIIIFVNDFKGYPQQLDLIKVTDSDV